jgi:hypothetical protein
MHEGAASPFELDHTALFLDVEGALIAFAPTPQSLFALAAIGRRDEARERFECILSCRDAFARLSEDVLPETGELWGNFPQADSMAGIFNTATPLSLSWREAWTCA